MTLICLNVGWKNKENDIPQVGWIHGGFHPMGFLSQKKNNNLKKQTQHVPTWSSAELTRSVFGGAFFFGSMLVFGGAVYPRVLNQPHVVIFLPDFGSVLQGGPLPVINGAK